MLKRFDSVPPTRAAAEAVANNTRPAGISRPAPGSNTAPVQLLKKAEYTALKALFSPHVKWKDFHAGQLDFQGKVDHSQGKDPYDYTTFGTEYEMIPYKAGNAIANTAHVKLAEGISMPVKSDVHEALVTDSDNVIEYVTPVFMLPLDLQRENLTTQVAEAIKLVRNMLIAFKKELNPEGFKTFRELLASDAMAFTAWQVQSPLNVSFREIDESTNIGNLASLTGNPTDVENIILGFDNIQKNAKHKELKNEDQPGSPLQSTVLLPLDLVAKIVRGTIDDANEKASHTGSIQNKGKRANTSAKKSTPSGGGPMGELINPLINSLKSARDNEALVDLIVLFSQRLLLVLEAPNAVKFQAHYQSLRFNGTPTITDGELLNQYDKEERQYNEAKAAGKTAEIPNNFHVAHSGIKDRLSVWTRIHMDDLIKTLARNFVKGDDQAFLKVLIGVVGKYGVAGREIYEKIERLMYAGLEYTPHDTVHFLDEHPEYIDLRQDTLREVQVINGRPWVLIEIRDLKDITLAKLQELGDKVRK